ncbi:MULTISPECIES: GNAT family N-acetyltransferase [Streptomyces]|uniref:GNAT family N-acetyltransferase n=1 Tax=Streptomyces TaxID=1883 RepID=UPI0021D96CC3|nr:GNAT family protein [Streptomyces sp. A13(2022)]MCU8593031.1 GNAT family N-acetyltransferase [Streptomyces sp. A13(2022)]
MTAPTPTLLELGVEMRPTTLEDAGPLSQAMLRNRSYLQPWEPDRPEEYYTEVGQRSCIKEQLAQRRAGTFMPWVLVEVKTGRIVGGISLSKIVLGPLRSASVGYWTDSEWAGRGLATAAVEAACLCARWDFALHRLEAGTQLHNLASQRVLKKAGFHRYGTAPKYLHINGAWRDHRLFQRILHAGPPL